MKRTSPPTADETSAPARPRRRQVLKGLAGVGFALPLALVPDTGEALEKKKKKKAVDPKRMRPQEDDVFVFSGGDRQGEQVAPEDLVIGDHPVLAFPKDPESGEVRNGSRLNRVALIRVDPDQFKDDESKSLSVDGIVGFSAICTHGGCLVEMWKEDDKAIFCPCHYSRFDPWRRGSVLGGPAPRRLPALPLKLADGQLKAAGTFDGTVGNR